MKKVKFRLLVIDASVARAAGKTEHPVSSACRNFLLDIMKICHRVALNAELRKEWNQHQSKFTIKWRSSMAARRKPLRNIKTHTLDIDVQSFAPKHRVAIQKDQCLIETALAADCEIVTLDDKLIIALGSEPCGERLRDRITWRHPVKDGTRGLS